jgi:hypothetical protein
MLYQLSYTPAAGPLPITVTAATCNAVWLLNIDWFRSGNLPLDGIEQRARVCGRHRATEQIPLDLSAP